MKLDVSRDVVSDLWPLCQSGEASPDSQAVVNQFLAQDAAFASTLKDGDALRRVVPSVRLSPDAELRLLQEAQQRARLKLLIVGGTIGLGFLLAFMAFAGVLLLFTRTGFRF